MRRTLFVGVTVLVAVALFGGGWVAAKASAKQPVPRPLFVALKYEGDWQDVRGTGPTPIARITQLCVRYAPYGILDVRVTCRDAYTATPGTDEERFRGERARGARIRACWEAITPDEPLPDCWR